MSIQARGEIKCGKCGLKPEDIDGVTFHWEVGMIHHLCSICRDPLSPLMVEIIEREIKKRLRKIGVKTVGCDHSKCNKEIFWLTTKNEKSMPVTLALISHFADCKYANKFRKK